MAITGHQNIALAFICHRKIWFCNEYSSNSIFIILTINWMWGLRESQYCLSFLFTRPRLPLHFFTHFLHTNLTVTHTFPLSFLPLALSFCLFQWSLQMTWGGRRREYSGLLWRSISSALTSVTKRGSTPRSQRTTAGLPNTTRPSLCKWLMCIDDLRDCFERFL